MFLCVLLQFMTNRLKDKVGPHAERLLKAYYGLLRIGNGVMVEECLDAIAALITEFPEILRQCHTDMQRVIVAALQKWNEPRVLVAGIGLLDAFLTPIAGRAFEMDQGAFLNNVVGTLLENLKVPTPLPFGSETRSCLLPGSAPTWPTRRSRPLLVRLVTWLLERASTLLCTSRL